MSYNRPWTQDEDKLVLEGRLNETELIQTLERTRNAIQARRNFLRKRDHPEDYPKADNKKIKNTDIKWDEESIKLLQSETLTDEGIAEKLHCNIQVVRRKRYSLFGTYVRSKPFWSADDDRIAADSTLTIVEAALLTGRSENEILIRRNVLKSGRYTNRNWTREEENLILSSELCDEELSAILSRSIKAINKRRSVLLGRTKLSLDSRHDACKKTAYKYGRRAWTVEEDRRVIEHSIPDIELSEQIQHSVQAIAARRYFLKTHAK